MRGAESIVSPAQLAQLTFAAPPMVTSTSEIERTIVP
jgi:hypothetical protein